MLEFRRALPLMFKRISERIEAIWDTAEAHAQFHRRKTVFFGFIIITLPQWGPSAKAFYWDAIAPRLTTDLTGIDLSWLYWSPWNWLTVPVGLIFIWVASRPKSMVTVTQVTLPEHPGYPLVDMGNKPYEAANTFRKPAPDDEEYAPPGHLSPMNHKLALSALVESEQRGQNRQRIYDLAERAIKGRATAEELVKGVTIPVELKWGGSRMFKGISDSPDMLVGVKCLLVDVRRFVAKHGWVTSQDTHSGGTFQPQLETGKNDMHCQQSVSFGSLAFENHRVSIQGNPVGGGGVDHCRIRTAGTWRLDFVLEDALGRTAKHSLCFEWDGEGKEPKVLEVCPSVEIDRGRYVSSAPPPPLTLPRKGC